MRRELTLERTKPLMVSATRGFVCWRHGTGNGPRQRAIVGALYEKYTPFAPAVP
jgi:hypothetical protein